MRSVLVAFSCVVLFANPVFAQDAVEADHDALVVKATAGQPEAPAIAAAKPAEAPYQNTMWIFFVGTGLIALAGWGITEWRKRQLLADDSLIEHLQTVSIGPKHQVALIEVDGRRMLLGLADGHMSLLDNPKRVATAPEVQEEMVETPGWYAAMQEALETNEAPRQAAKTQESVVERYLKDSKSGVSSLPKEYASATLRSNRESDSVIVGLKALEARNRGAA